MKYSGIGGQAVIEGIMMKNGELMFKQPYRHSSHIIATVEVKKIVDEFSLYAKTNICDEEILIEFESKVKYGINDRIYVVGSLEFDIISSIKA